MKTCKINPNGFECDYHALMSAAGMSKDMPTISEREIRGNVAYENMKLKLKKAKVLK